MKRLLAAAVFSVMGLSSNAFALEFEWTSIDFPGALFTQAQGINDKGDIVGNYSELVGNFVAPHGFLYSNGQFTTIDRPVPGRAFTDTVLTDINYHGIIAGNYFSGQGRIAFTYDGNQFTDIFPPFPDAVNSSAFGRFNPGINDDGHVAGTYEVNGVDSAGYIYDGSSFTKVYVGFETMVNDINNLDQVVGSHRVGNGEPRGEGERRGFFWDDGSVVDIFFPGSTSTEALALNDAGVITGLYRPDEPFFGASGFVFDGEYHDVNFPGSFATAIFGINNLGELVGSYADNTGTHGFFATPVRNGAAVPEPSEFILFGMALVGIGGAYFLIGRKSSTTAGSIA